jgi:hypothetical protein
MVGIFTPPIGISELAANGIRSPRSVGVLGQERLSGPYEAVKSHVLAHLALYEWRYLK